MNKKHGYNNGNKQWRGVNFDISIVMPLKPTKKDRLLGCSQRTS